MPPQLNVDEVVASRTVETEVSRNVSIPTRLPPAERVVSVNARVELTSITAERDYVVISGIIRSTVFYASADDPSDVVSISRNFDFTDRVSVRGSRPGLEAIAEMLISDIDFSLINERLINVVFTVASDVELSTTERVPIVEEPEFVRRERFRIRRTVRERNYTRNLVSTTRLSADAEDMRRIIDVESNITITSIITDYDRITVRGAVNSNILYVDSGGELEYANVSYGFRENFDISGVTPDMEAYVETRIIQASGEIIDGRRIRITTNAGFNVLVVVEEVIEVPTDITVPDRYPIRRTVIVERVVTEERTRILERQQVTVPEGSPDVARVISVNGNIRGGSVSTKATRGGVSVSGVVDVNIIYVADLPQQPVYFIPGSVTFSSFIDIPEVRENMQVYADIDINNLTGTRVSERAVNVRLVMDINLVVTERVRVPVVTGITDEPIREPVEPVEPADYITYVVRSGDTLFLIAQRFGVTVDRLVAINNIRDSAQLQVGQQLLIPRG